jgi:hypothetical protein
MTGRVSRCLPCLALVASVLAAFFTRAAYAATGPAADVSADVWLGLFTTILFAMVAGYAKGQDKRIGLLEHEQKQTEAAISLLRETVIREHPSRMETAEHRAYVEGKLARLDERFDTLLMEIRSRR